MPTDYNSINFRNKDVDRFASKFGNGDPIKPKQRNAADDAMESFKKPTTIKKTDAVVSDMINKAEAKRKLANQQEKIALERMKMGNDDVRVVDLKGTTTPTNKRRMENANKLKQEAKREFQSAVLMSNNNKKK